MASSMGMACGSWIQGGYLKGKRKNIERVCCSSASLTDQYRTLRIQLGAFEKEVKKAFRQLALQMVMTNLRESNSDDSSYQYSEDSYDDSMRGMHDPSWDLWEEWMGWEGAGIRDYTSHINPYI